MKMFGIIRNEAGEELDYAFHEGGRSGAVIVICHGVTAHKDRELLIAIAAGLSELGWPCLRFSFSGNGKSEGRFEDATITKESGDLKSVFSLIPEGKRIGFIGHSMGAAVGMVTAAEEKRIASMVTMAGMMRTREFVDREFGDVVQGEGVMWEDEDCPLSKAFVEDLRSIGDVYEEAAVLELPWLLIHGRDDDVIPIFESREALRSGPEGTRLIEIEGAGHMFGPESYGRITEELDAFFSETLWG